MVRKEGEISTGGRRQHLIDPRQVIRHRIFRYMHEALNAKIQYIFFLINKLKSLIYIVDRVAVYICSEYLTDRARMPMRCHNLFSTDEILVVDMIHSSIIQAWLAVIYVFLFEGTVIYVFK